MPNPFLPQKGYKHITTKITPRDEVVVKFHRHKDFLVKGDASQDQENFLTEEKPVLEQEFPLNEFIQQFDREVDLKEKLMRLTTKSEYEEFIGATGLPADGKTYVQQDYLSDIEMDKIIQRGKEAWNNLDPVLKKDMTEQEFLASFNQKTFDAYMAESIAREKAKTQVKEEVKENA